MILFAFLLSSLGSLAGVAGTTVAFNDAYTTLTFGVNHADTTFSGTFTGGGTAQKVGTGTITFDQTGTWIPVSGKLMFYGGGIKVAPVGSGADVAVEMILGLFYDGDMAAGTTLTLDRGSNTSLTVTDHGLTSSRNGKGVLLIAPAHGTRADNFGAASGGERFRQIEIIPDTIDGMIYPYCLAQDNGPHKTGDFLTFDETNGYKTAAGLYVNKNGGTFTPANNQIINVTADSTVTSSTATATALATRVTDATLTIDAGKTYEVGSRTGSSYPIGLILNGGTITGGTAASFYGRECIVYADVAGGTIYSKITNGALTKVGPGTLTLVSAGNDFNKGICVEGGTLTFAASGSAASQALTVAGGTFDLGARSMTMKSLTLCTGSVTNGTLILEGDATVQDGVISAALAESGGARSVTKKSPGKVTLAAANTFTGPTTVYDGVLEITGSIASGRLSTSNTGLVILSGPAAAGTGTTYIGGWLQLNHASPFGAGATLDLAFGVIEAIGADRTVTPNATLTQSAFSVQGSRNLTFSGTFTNSGGDQTLTNCLEPGATLTIAGNVYVSETASTGRTMTVAGRGDTIISGSIADFNGTGAAGGLAVTSQGITTLSGANSYRGTTALSASGATLVLAGSNSSSGVTTVTGAASTLRLANPAANGGLASGVLTMQGDFATLNVAGGPTAISNGVVLASPTLITGKSLTINGAFTNQIAADNKDTEGGLYNMLSRNAK